MKLQTIITQLSGGAHTLRKVEGSAELAALKSGITTAPRAYVVPLSEKAGPNLYETGAVQQRVEVRFGVVYLVRNMKDARGQKAHDMGLEVVRREGLDALVGWSPDVGIDVCTYAGGRLLNMKDQTVFWQDEFITSYFERH